MTHYIFSPTLRHPVFIRERERRVGREVYDSVVNICSWLDCHFFCPKNLLLAETTCITYACIHFPYWHITFLLCTMIHFTRVSEQLCYCNMKSSLWWRTFVGRLMYCGTSRSCCGGSSCMCSGIDFLKGSIKHWLVDECVCWEFIKFWHLFIDQVWQAFPKSFMNVSKAVCKSVCTHVSVCVRVCAV